MRTRLLAVLPFVLIACGGTVDPLEAQKEADKTKNKVGTPTDDSIDTEAGPTGPTMFVPMAYTQDGPISGSVHVQFEVTRNGSVPGFYDSPWPSEMAKHQDGTIAFEQLPQSSRAIVSTYVSQAKKDLKGFSLAQTAYFHFTGEPNLTALPSPGDSMRKEAPLFLLDVDPASPEKGTFIPIEFRFYDKDVTYVSANVLAAKPLQGFVLRPGNLYAYVVRRDFGDHSGAPLGTAADLEAVKWTESRSNPDEEGARTLHQPTLDYLESLGVLRGDIAAIALFRTQVAQDVTMKMLDVATNLTGNYTPKIVDAAWGSEGTDYALIAGHYCTPNFQTKIENAPFTAADGGTVAFDPYGTPLVSDIAPGYRNDADPNSEDQECTPLMKARFVLTFPKNKAMPAGGWPLLISAHGTGGDAYSFTGDDDFAGWSASLGMAVVSTDQPLHGTATDPGRRPGSDAQVVLNVGGIPLAVPAGLNLTPAEMFYNPVNPGAGRDNARQSTIDTAVLARLISSTDFGTAKYNSSALLVPKTGRTRPRFDAGRVLLAGHSQGSQTVAPQAAVDPLIKGVLLSGCGGDIRYGILERKNPFEMKGLLSGLLGMQANELDEFHPVMALAQTFADAVDPQTYARFYREPLEGRRAQNVLHYVGTNDTYNPRPSGIAMAVALRATQLQPVADPVIGLSILNITPAASAKANNGSSATIAFIELLADSSYDGHFVLYYHPGASDLAKEFFSSVLSSGNAAPTIGPFTGTGP